MKVTYRSSLGTTDAKAFGVDSAKAGDEVDLPTEKVKAITEKFPGMFEDEETLKAVAAKAAIHGTPEKATEDLKRYKETGTTVKQ